MAGNRIPDDFDLDADLTCWRVWWPNSTLWYGLLRGLLTSPERGRFWERSTGVIKQAQYVGHRIADANTDLMVCDGLVPFDEYQDLLKKYNELLARVSGGGIVIEDESDMGQVVTEVKIVDGKLRVYYGHCCYEDLDLAVSASEAAPTLPDEPFDEEQYPEQQYSACGKAHALISLLFAGVEAVASQNANPLFWQWKNNVQEQLPGVTIATEWMIAAQGQYAIIKTLDVTSEWFYLDGLWDEETIRDTDLYNQWVCRAKTKLSDDGLRPTTDEVKAALNAGYGLYPLAVQTFLQQVALMIGYGDLADAAALGALDTTSECDCPQLNPYDVLTYYEREYTFNLDYFSPNTDVTIDELLSGDIDTGSMIACIIESVGTANSNGQARITDGVFDTVVCNPGTGVEYGYAMYFTAEGLTYLQLYHSQYASPGNLAGGENEFADGLISVRYTGNNAQINATGTITAIYKRS